MGEYIKKDGQQIKLGTCEDLNYITLRDYCDALRAGRLEQMRGNDAPRNYIDGSYRFRFPHIKSGGFDDGLQLIVPKSVKIGASDHGEICASVKTRNGDQSFNVFMPCPASGKFELRTSINEAAHLPRGYDVVSIVQQRPLDGQVWTVLRCEYCGQVYRIDAEDAERLASWIGAEFDPNKPHPKDLDTCQHMVGVAREIIAGYLPDNLYAQMIREGFISKPEPVTA